GKQIWKANLESKSGKQIWKANLDNDFSIPEIKSAPDCPWSHPVIELLIGSCRREFTDPIFFGGSQIYSQSFQSSKSSSILSAFITVVMRKSQMKLQVSDNGLQSILKKFKCKPVGRGMYYTSIAA
ncbi:MAG: hypothetical protein WCI18_11520, partial [Pseudomonadota bacterium]